MSRGTLVLVTSSVLGAYVTTFHGVLPKVREFPGDAGIKGTFFPLEGQFFPGYQRGKYSSVYIRLLPTGETFKCESSYPQPCATVPAERVTTRVILTVLVYGHNP